MARRSLELMMVTRGALGLIAAVLGCARLATAQAPGAGGSLYVAQMVGRWQVDSATRPLRHLDAVSATARLRPVDTGAVSRGYRLVLRDPGTLRTYTFTCAAARQCDRARAVRELRSAGSAIPGSRRTGALFLQLGGNEELRNRVDLLGARGDDRDWGLQVLVVHEGVIDAAPLALRAGTESRLVARFCALQGGSADAAEECRRGRDIMQSDCRLGQDRRCAWSPSAPLPAAVRLDVYRREVSMLSSLALAHGVAVIVAASDAQAATDLAMVMSHELTELRAHVSPEELRGLYAAAAVEVARAVTEGRR